MVAARDDSAPIGILGPQWWARTQRSQRRRNRSHKSLQTETRHVVTALRRVEDRRRALGIDTRLWFQLDRGFDAWPVFQLARDLGLLLTVRSSVDRRIRTRQGTGRRDDDPALGSRGCEVEDEPGRDRHSTDAEGDRREGAGAAGAVRQVVTRLVADRVVIAVSRPGLVSGGPRLETRFRRPM
jgi:hypothetical protein